MLYILKLMTDEIEKYDLSLSTLQSSQTHLNITQSIKYILQPTFTVFSQKISNFLNSSLKQISNTQQQLFAKRKLFVLFEQDLNCNPTTDHLIPKDVFPIFQTQIAKILKLQQTLFNEELAQQIEFLIPKIESKLSQNLGDLINLADSFGLALVIASQENVDMQKIMTKLQKLSIDEKIKLRKEIIVLREQMHQKRRITMLFKTDFDSQNSSKINPRKTQGDRIEDLEEEIQRLIMVKEQIEKSYMKELKLREENQIRRLQLESEVQEKDAIIDRLRQEGEAYQVNYQRLQDENKGNQKQIMESKFKQQMESKSAKKTVFKDGLDQEIDNKSDGYDENIINMEFQKMVIENQQILEAINNNSGQLQPVNNSSQFSGSFNDSFVEKLKLLPESEQIRILLQKLQIQEKILQKRDIKSTEINNKKYASKQSSQKLIPQQNSALRNKNSFELSIINVNSQKQNQINSSTQSSNKSNQRQLRPQCDAEYNEFKQFLEDEKTLDISKYALLKAQEQLLTRNIQIQVTDGIDNFFIAEIADLIGQQVALNIIQSDKITINNVVDVDGKLYINGKQIPLRKNSLGQYIDQNNNIIQINDWYFKNNMLVDLYGCKITDQSIIENQWNEEIKNYNEFLISKGKKSQQHQGIISAQETFTNIFNEFGIMLDESQFKNIFDHIQQMLQRRQITIDKWKQYENCKTEKMLQGNQRNYQQLLRNKLLFNLALIAETNEFHQYFKEGVKQNLPISQNQLDWIQTKSKLNNSCQNPKQSFRKQQNQPKEILTVKCQYANQIQKQVMFNFKQEQIEPKYVFKQKNLFQTTQ
ncbi:hypothetical protein SS50377_25483 [Spironucleus salmonicida]|uniref:Uncharacterized protein n=1 Tax=Spironucleus salmonicida TaxID=348837 RepID=V6LMU1_9EUKA|nr:hypothetical protein SS50377_25483 [Spironucleus salmonicida]|eukprot:EST45031.1 hypothetical protein SS50377_15050 [Spironucleus salmonicida]